MQQIGAELQHDLPIPILALIYINRHANSSDIHSFSGLSPKVVIKIGQLFFVVSNRTQEFNVCRFHKKITRKFYFAEIE